MIEIWDDLVGEILVRLLVKSLLRFKCVDKRWNDLFRKPTFTNRNMKIHEKKKKQRVMIRESDEPPRFMILENDEILEFDWQNPFPDDRVIWTLEFDGTYNVLPVKCNTNYFQDGFLFNGVLHWVSVGEKQEDEDCILRFDFRNNQFTTIDLPSEVDDLS
ncbi:hypothetical protein TanjilG_10017 [Lupinus angustifolius]|uniref:Uncharacterized protein n=1 Tax=Lupinus angustifolius TaxID=3871 RepID=A0A1J7HKK5_LUPAN|nr:hypothetical protein TanjilG_10017 [Lupinus angustifolius]